MYRGLGLELAPGIVPPGILGEEDTLHLAATSPPPPALAKARTMFSAGGLQCGASSGAVFLFGTRLSTVEHCLVWTWLGGGVRPQLLCSSFDRHLMPPCLAFVQAHHRASGFWPSIAWPVQARALCTYLPTLAQAEPTHPT